MAMDFDRLGEIWRREHGADNDSDPAAQIRAVRARASELERVVRRRDRIETTVALLLVPFFGWVALTTPHTLSATGAWILVAACLFVPIRLRLARRSGPDPGQPLAAALRAELARIRAQERLLSSVVWWYAGPLITGAILIVVGSPVSGAFKVAYALGALGLGTLIVRWNLTAARRELGPVAQELEAWLADLDAWGETRGRDHP